MSFVINYWFVINYVFVSTFLFMSIIVSYVIRDILIFGLICVLFVFNLFLSIFCHHEPNLPKAQLTWPTTQAHQACEAQQAHVAPAHTPYACLSPAPTLAVPSPLAHDSPHPPQQSPSTPKLGLPSHCLSPSSPPASL